MLSSHVYITKWVRPAMLVLTSVLSLSYRVIFKFLNSCYMSHHCPLLRRFRTSQFPSSLRFLFNERIFLFYFIIRLLQNPVWPAWAQVHHLLSATDWICCWQKSQRAPSSRTCLLLFFTNFFPCDDSISITDIYDPWLKILDVFCEEIVQFQEENSHEQVWNAIDRMLLWDSFNIT